MDVRARVAIVPIPTTHALKWINRKWPSGKEVGTERFVHTGTFGSCFRMQIDACIDCSDKLVETTCTLILLETAMVTVD